MDSNLGVPTKLEYYDDMSRLQSKATLLSFSKGEDGRQALILDSTIFHPQGGGQPADTGFITPIAGSGFKFLVNDVRSKDGIVYHYGVIEDSGGNLDMEVAFKGEKEVLLCVNESRRKLNSRLHSAGHLLDACLQNVGLGHLKPGKAYHFPDGPFVEYEGIVPRHEVQSKQKELELEANALIARGGKITAAVLPYEEACNLCGGSLPDYIPKGSTPRIVKLGDNPGCPCGGTHVSDILEIASLKGICEVNDKSCQVTLRASQMPKVSPEQNILTSCPILLNRMGSIDIDAISTFILV